MALITVGGDLEFSRALNQMKEAANCGDFTYYLG
jgi:hypothetical protein